jgi:hypothetical protein
MASTMENSSNPPSRSDTVNGARYQSANARLYLNPDGLPVAFRRVPARQPGTFAGSAHYEIITPKGTGPFPCSTFRAYKSRCAPPN